MCLLLVKEIHSPTRVRIYVMTVRTILCINHIIRIRSFLIFIVYIFFIKAL